MLWDLFLLIDVETFSFCTLLAGKHKIDVNILSSTRCRARTCKCTQIVRQHEQDQSESSDIAVTDEHAVQFNGGQGSFPRIPEESISHGKFPWWPVPVQTIQSFSAVSTVFGLSIHVG